jgi:uncharacterized protein YdeI (YjbR/CyaY-like superfamily)
MSDRAAWRSWLEANHDASTGIWLQLEKVGPAGRLKYEEAVEEALCFGWIDGQVRGVDATRYVRLFTPRKPKSDWSRVNKQRVERLQRDGLMTAAGLAAIETAVRTGSWSILDAVEEMVVPDDLAEALSADATAKGNFDAFPASARKDYLYWVLSAKRPATRAERVRKAVELAAANKASRYDQQ